MISCPSLEVLSGGQSVPLLEKLIKSTPPTVFTMRFYTLGHCAPALMDLTPGIIQLETQNPENCSNKPFRREAKKHH